MGRMASGSCGLRVAGVLLVLVVLMQCWPRVLGVFDVGLPQDDYYMEGDINLGALVRLTWSEADEKCGTRLSRPGVEVAAAIRFAIDKINEDESVLPGIRLGLAMLNDCNRPSVALARAAKFAPLKHCMKECVDKCVSEGSRASYNVVGVMGPYNSPMAISVASFLGLYEIPVMSWSATSPTLSGSKKFKYFARSVPSDEHIIEAIVALLKEFGWTYVSVLNTAGSRDQVAMFRQLTKKVGICIAYESELSKDDSEEEYDSLIETLLGTASNKKPRVIFVPLGGSTTETLLLAMERNNVTEPFVFIGLDGFKPNLASRMKTVLPIKAITFEFPTSAPDFKDYYDNSSPFRNDKDPWVGEFTKQELNCSTDSGCKYKILKDVPAYNLYGGVGKVTAIVRTYAKALDKLIRERCNWPYNRAELSSCVNGKTLFEYITNTSFEHHGTYIEYDEKGDVYGDYEATFTWGNDEPAFTERMRALNSSRARLNSDQSGLRYNEVKFGRFSRKHQNLSIDWNFLPWSQPDPTEMTSTKPIPQSICSEPCAPGERLERQDLPCCWECKRCRPNEIVTRNFTECYTCAKFHWPDETYETCQHIAPVYMPYSALEISVALIICALFGLASVVVITALFIKHWERKVVKGCTRQLMVPIMLGLVLGYLTVCLSIVPPGQLMCYLSFICFHLSLCLLFGPLFLKTHRVHLIFRASDRCKKRVKLADSKSMMIGLAIVVSIQLLLIGGVIMIAHILRDPIHVELIQQNREVELVQRSCHLPTWVVLVPLAYNILLLFLCAIYGFLTRKLPENYNESWYIFIAVTTTIFVWIACIPTYLVAEQAKFQVALLSTALIVNAVVISVCLFMPKIYAVYNVPERDIRISRLGSRRLSLAVGESESMNNRSK